MKKAVKFSADTKEYLKEQRNFIALDNPKQAEKYIVTLLRRIEKMLEFPYIGKVNATYKKETIREIFIDGYKIIYKIDHDTIQVLIIYKRIDLNESTASIE